MIAGLSWQAWLTIEIYENPGLEELMPLSFQRLPPRGFTDPREVAEKLNGLGDATASQVAAVEARLNLLESLIVTL